MENHASCQTCTPATNPSANVVTSSIRTGTMFHIEPNTPWVLLSVDT